MNILSLQSQNDQVKNDQTQDLKAKIKTEVKTETDQDETDDEIYDDEDEFISRQFSCDMCEKVFGQMSLLESHIVSVHLNKSTTNSLEISINGSKSAEFSQFESGGKLDDDSKIGQTENVHKCQLCDKSFLSGQYLSQHHTKEHLNESISSTLPNVCPKQIEISND